MGGKTRKIAFQLVQRTAFDCRRIYHQTTVLGFSLYMGRILYNRNFYYDRLADQRLVRTNQGNLKLGGTTICHLGRVILHTLRDLHNSLDDTKVESTNYQQETNI